MPVSATAADIEAVGRAHPTTRKLLVAPTINWAREALLALARRTGGWIGWEPATLRSLAGDLALVGLEAQRVRIAGDVEIAALVDRALSETVAAREVGSRFASLADGLGFRRAVRDAVLELRTAGVSPAALKERAPRQSPAQDLATLFARYEGLLAEQRVADSAAVFRAALEAFDREAPFVLGGSIVLAPGLRERGLPAALVQRLSALGAHPLAADNGDPVPVALFAAASPVNEIREVLRRALAAGARWDEVEIVTTDPDSYGIALDAVAEQCAISYTFLTGHALAQTRVGRALGRWLDWIGDGLPADLIREALEAGELALPDADIAPTALARPFRALGIGWGRARYVDAIAKLRDAGYARRRGPREDEDPQAFAERVARQERTHAVLGDLLDRLLSITPEVPERGSDRAVRASVVALAEATLAWLDLLPLHGEVEHRTASRLRTRLLQLASLEGGDVSFSAALAELRDALSDLRAWTEASDHRKPWASGGGAVHLTDVAHGALTGRPHVFVVGLDADRVAGPRVQDAMLNDECRHAVEPLSLATTGMRREERAASIARLLAGVRGEVTLSYSVAGSDEAASGPAHQLLQAFRVERGDPALDYEALRKHLGVPACAVPSGVPALDARETWLAALADGALLLDGERQVRQAFAALDQGLAAIDIREGAELSGHHGLIADAAGLLDPRRSARPLSASSLELLAKCPLAWFYSYGLNIRPPDDPAYDPEVWLDAMQRGSLLHELFERFTRSYAGRQAEIVTADAEAAILAMAEELLAKWRGEVPPPSEAVFLSEAAYIRQSALTFLEAEREARVAGRDGTWLEFELRFGHDEPVTLAIGDGRIPVYGYIDRVDRLRDGRLRVIDYKTGSPSYYRQKEKLGPFNAGRNLQAAVYAAGAEAVLGAEVAVFEYRFPTVKGESDAVAYDTTDFAVATGIIEELLAHIMKGEYIPTTDCADCRFCSFGAVCRISVDRWGTVESIRASWAAENAADIPAYAAMLARRSSE